MSEGEHSHSKESLPRRLVMPFARWFLRNAPDRLAVWLKYRQMLGKFPDLTNPRTFNEKVAWRKLYEHDPAFPAFADKVTAKDKAAELIGREHIIETLWVGDDPADIPFDTLAPPYVIKANHASGGNFLVHSKADIDRPRIIASLRKQLAHNYGEMAREWAYINLPRKVMVERLLLTPQGDVPEDIKFFTYHGRVHFIQVVTERFTDHKLSFFDRDWNKLSVELAYPPIVEELPRPKNLDQMLAIAETIGRQFTFVRVDLYTIPQGIYFGEATFYPNAGYEPFRPEDWDLKFGEPWKVP